MIIIFIVFVSFYSFYFIGCSSEDKPRLHNDEIIFNVDSSKIDRAIFLTDLGISISPPKNWLSIDSSVISNIIQKVNFRMDADSNIARLVILNLFFDTTSKAMLLIGNIVSKSSADSVINNYEESLERVKDSFTFQKAKFLKSGINLNQYLIQEKDWVNFRFLGISPRVKVFQLDYVIPKSNFSPEIAKAIESSLGTLSFISTKH
ncbi:MAG: hypothetical protein ACUVQ1_03610 [Candidatus Kapaibacteriales bacterium]